MKGEDQQNQYVALDNQYFCWVRNGEMNMQLEERFVNDIKESSCGTSPTPSTCAEREKKTRESKSKQLCTLPRNWSLPGILAICYRASSPGFLQEV